MGSQIVAILVIVYYSRYSSHIIEIYTKVDELCHILNGRLLLWRLSANTGITGLGVRHCEPLTAPIAGAVANRKSSSQLLLYWNSAKTFKLATKVIHIECTRQHTNSRLKACIFSLCRYRLQCLLN